MDVATGSVAPFTTDELLLTASRLPRGKAPGPDLVPNEVVTQAIKARPALFLELFNRCLCTGMFPGRWKAASLVLLPKNANKPPDEPSSYRPLSLLDGMGKVLERMMLTRINEHTLSTGCLSPNQHGFRRGQSTMDALKAVTDQADTAARGSVQDRHLCAVVALDVKNAFNSAPWTKIDAALRRRAFPAQLIRLVRSYLTDRTLFIGAGDDGPTRLTVTCGVPQGSVIGPALWNLFYDDLLQLPVPRGVSLICFADDLAVVTIAHNAELLEEAVNPTLGLIDSWMTDNGLEVSPAKSEAIILTRKWAYTKPAFTMRGTTIPIKSSMKYLGVHLDTRRTFNHHTRSVTAAVRKTTAAIGRIMPNVAGPSARSRQLLMSATLSKLMYAAPVWSPTAASTASNREAMTQAQRTAALRITRSYCTVSDMAALVMAKMPPFYLLADERVRTANGRLSRPQDPLSLIRSRERATTLQQWQTIWNTTPKAAWTRKLLPDVARWFRHFPGEVTYHLAQTLTGHGCFEAYLHSKKRALIPTCRYCGLVDDTAEHTIFRCSRWKEDRLVLTSALRRPPTPDDVEAILCGPRPEDLPEELTRRNSILMQATKNRAAFINMCSSILGRKEEDERERQALARRVL